MSKILMFSDLWLPTFPFLDLKLYHELVGRGINVQYILQKGDVRLVLPELSKVYNPIATIITKPKMIVSMMDKNDLLVMRFAYKGVAGDVASAVRAAGKQILMLDPAAVDLCHRECPAQYITSKSEWMTEQVKKKFNKKYKNVFTTGTIHFDAAHTRLAPNRGILMKEYGLDSSKRLAVLCKASQGEIGHQKGVDNEYKQIVDIIKTKCPNYEILFKCHPIDHLSQYQSVPGIIHKNEHYNNKPSWEALFPNGVDLVKPEQGYDVFAYADVILNVRSSVAMESMLFPTPLVNVNTHKYLANWPKSDDNGVMKFIKIEELADILNNNDYFVDKDACHKHVLRYCDPAGDGKAYVRTADVIAKLI